MAHSRAKRAFQSLSFSREGTGFIQMPQDGRSARATLGVESHGQVARAPAPGLLSAHLMQESSA